MIEILLKTSFFSSLLSHLIGKHKGKREAKTTLKLLLSKISKWSFNLLDLTLNSPNFQFCHFNPLIMTNTYILYACMYLCMNACMNNYAFRMGYYTKCSKLSSARLVTSPIQERREREYVGPITRDIFDLKCEVTFPLHVVEFLFSYSSCHLNTIPIFITLKFHMICHKL